MDATRVAAFTWLAIGDTLVQYTAIAGVEQRRIAVGDPIVAVGAAGTDLIVVAGGRILQYRSPDEPPAPLDVSPNARIVDGDQVVWLLDRGHALRVREHHLDPPVEERAAVATVVGDELWWATSSGTIESSSRRSLPMPNETVPDAMVGCSGALWLAYGSTIERITFSDARRGDPIESPIGPCRRFLCAGGMLVGASARRLFGFNPMNPAGPSVIEHEFGADIVALVPGPELVWVVTASPEVGIVRFD